MKGQDAISWGVYKRKGVYKAITQLSQFKGQTKIDLPYQNEFITLKQLLIIYITSLITYTSWVLGSYY